MKMRLPLPLAAPGALRAAGCAAAGAVLLAVTVSACTAGGSGSSVPSVFTPTPSITGPSSAQGTRTPSPAGGSSRSAGASASGTPRASISSRPPVSATATATHTQTPAATHTPTATHLVAPTHSAVPTHSATPASSEFPTAAPETGGGGTAGLQDGLLFGAGGAAVLAGFGALAYRRRLARKFGIHEPAERDPADREPADR
jgi:hypothetical protein